VRTRSRILGFGSAALLVAVGVVCAVAVGGGTGESLALALISLGVVEATSLVFLEVGFSEDHDRAREEAARVQEARLAEARRDPHDHGSSPKKRRIAAPGSGRSRLDRMRGRPRRLR
jgi:hypothetical protein